MNRLKISKFQAATFIALLFHICGFIGLFTAKHDWFVANTPLNLLIMFGLLIWTQAEKNAAFFAFVFICFAAGMFAEITGVNTGLLFGHYRYSKVLGPSFRSVPWLIGINWFTIVYCCGVVISFMYHWFQQKSPAASSMLTARARFISFVFDGALLATFFDFVLEPVAVKLGYWRWLGDGIIPLANYSCWFIVSALLLAAFKLLSFPRLNQFAVHLLIIELLFFGALRTFL